MGDACDTWETGGEHTGFWWGDLREGDHLEDLGIDERVILKLIFSERDDAGGGGTDWIDLVQDRDRWRAFVKKLSGSINCGECLSSLRPVSFSGRNLLLGVS
jgi:hypothetical protein